MIVFRLVDEGAELFAMAAPCGRAQRLHEEDPATGRRAVEMADLFCFQARERAQTIARARRRNTDVATCGLAQTVLAGEHRWLERGIAGV